MGGSCGRHEGSDGLFTLVALISVLGVVGFAPVGRIPVYDVLTSLTGREACGQQTREA
jgi:hypothetical protein